MNGAWFDPDTPGQGFFIDVLPGQPTLFLGWFTFDTSQATSTKTAVVGDDNHRWLTALGPFEGDTAMLDVILTTGGLFNDPTAPVTDSFYGSLTVTFDDCGTGEVVYDLTSPTLSGRIPIQRVANDNVPLCEQLNAGGGESKIH